jgi:hypothetical protein
MSDTDKNEKQAHQASQMKNHQSLNTTQNIIANRIV